MATIPTLPNWRQESDGTIRVRLRDSGVAADWSGMLTACVAQKLWTN